MKGLSALKKPIFEVFQTLITPASVGIRDEIKKKVSEKLLPEYEREQKIISETQAKFPNITGIEEVFQLEETRNSPYEFTNTKGVSHLHNNLFELSKIFTFYLYSWYTVDKITKKIKKRNSHIRETYAQLVSEPKGEIFNNGGKEILENARKGFIPQELAQIGIKKLIDAYEKKQIDIFSERTSKRSFQSLKSDNFTHYGLDFFFSSPDLSNLQSPTFSDLADTLTYIHEEILKFSHFFSERFNFFDSQDGISTFFNLKPSLSSEDSDFIASAQVSMNFVNKIVANDTPLRNYFSFEEKEILLQIFTLQKCLGNILSREKILSLEHDYEDGYKFLALLFYLKNLIDTHKSLFDSVGSLQRMYGFTFGNTFTEASLKLFSGSPLEKKILTDKKITPLEKTQLSTIILAGYKYFLMGIAGNESFEIFFTYIYSILGDKPKVRSIIRFFIDSQKYSRSLPLEQLITIFRNNFEVLPYIQEVVYDFFPFFEKFIKGKYEFSILEGFSFEDFVFIVKMSDEISQVQILSQKQDIASYKNTEKLLLSLQKNLSILPTSHEIFLAYSDKIFSCKNILFQELLEKISDLEKRYPQTSEILGYFKKFGKTEEDKVYLEYFLELDFGGELGRFFSHFFSMSSLEKGFIFLLFKKLGRSYPLMWEFYPSYDLLFSHENKTILYDCVMDIECEKEFLVEILHHILDASSLLVSKEFEILESIPMSFHLKEKLYPLEISLKKEIYDTFKIIPAVSQQDFLDFISIQEQIDIKEVKNIRALLTFFSKFGIHNFLKIGKLFEFCFENIKIQERIYFLYERILDYELNDGEEKDFKDIILHYIKNGNQKELDDYFFTLEELDSVEKSTHKINGKVAPLLAPEVIRKLLRLGYIEDRKGGGHRVFFKEGFPQKIVVPYSRKNRLSKFTLKGIVENIGLTLEEWNSA